MLNQILFIGRLTTDPELIVLEDGKKVSNITLAVQRPFKNHEGLYETDFISITLWQGLAENLSKFCVKGTLVLIRGRVQTKKVFIEDKVVATLEIIGERVSYLSSNKATVFEEEA